LRGQAFHLYAQDTWKVTPRLTVNYGLRYEVPSPYTEKHNLQNLWIPGRQSTVFPTAPEALLYPGDKGVPAGLIPTDRNGFAPRVGLAWDVTGTGRCKHRSARRRICRHLRSAHQISRILTTGRICSTALLRSR
jgi:hypothetical protein